jgi:hypothetical protein
MTLGEHLRTEQDAWSARIDSLYQFGHGSSALHGLTVDTFNGPIREATGKKILGLLRAQSVGKQVTALAITAVCGQSGGGAAVMASQLSLPSVHSEARIAGHALCNPATVVTLKAGGVAAAIKEQQYLLIRRECLLDSVHQRWREPGLQRLFAQINSLQVGQGTGAGARGQPVMVVAPG